MKSITIRRSIIISVGLVILFINMINAEEAKKNENTKKDLVIPKKYIKQVQYLTGLEKNTKPAQPNKYNKGKDFNRYTKSPELDYNRKITGISSRFENVTLVHDISPAGRAALELQNSGDNEYIKLIENGFESPTFTTQIVENRPTPVEAAANINYLWKTTTPRDARLWQNVEFNRYNNRLLDTSRYFTPAHFTMNDMGNTVVHAPSNHGLQVTSPASTTLTTADLNANLKAFLETEESVEMEDASDSEETEDVEKRIEEGFKNYYSFLK